MQWLDIATCDFCGCSESALYLESSVPSWYENRKIRIVQCSSCGLAYASPRPDAHELYEAYIAGDARADAHRERKLSRPDVINVHRKHIEKAAKHLPYKPKRLYDMGCGAGTVMLAAKELGIAAHGNDVNKACVDWLNEQGLHARHGFTQEVPLPAKRMDIVINLDYIEHTYTPTADLQRCFDMLRPGGILYLKTLYLGCPDHQTKGEAWQLFGCGHFYYFTPDVLVAMVKRAGFEIIETKLSGLITIIARRPWRPGVVGAVLNFYQRLAA